jgi:outer membrane protein TolC
VTTAADQAGTIAAFAYILTLRTEAECLARSADSVFAADLVRIATHLQQANAGIVLDVTRAQAQLASIHAQLIVSRNARDRARLELLRALNLPLSTTLRLHDSLDSLTLGGLTTDEPTAVHQALANRPDLRAAGQRIAATRQSVSAIRAERFPILRFVGNEGVNSNGYSHLLRTYTYAVELSVPIFDGALREARLQEQVARLREAEVQDTDLRDQAEVDVRAALLDFSSAQQQVDAAREAAQLAEEEVVQARNRFQQGVVGNADVITALLARTVAQTAMIGALTNAQYARIGLARAQGIVTTLP